jgi:DNA repair exonuclease SbcCD ATPase subunit
MLSISLSIFEIVVLFISAIVIGFVVNLFFSNRKGTKREEGVKDEKKSLNSGLDEWKLKYISEAERKDKEISDLKSRLHIADENKRIYDIEMQELKNQVRKLSFEAEQSKTEKPVLETRADYYEQLRQAQQSLMDHNAKISRLLEQVDVIKETEEKSQEILRSNEELSMQIKDLKYMLVEKEDEINHIKQKEHLTSEMSAMLDSAYSEFNTLQGKIHKLESQLSSSKMVNIEYEDLKEAYYKVVRELDEQKNKTNHYLQENQALQIDLSKVEDKLSESNQQRQQLQKKVAYLEELNNDLHQMSEANKKLESQIKRLGELESRLHIVSEERDQLKEKTSGL